MGSSQSNAQIQNLQIQHEALLKQHQEMSKQMLEQQAENKKQQEAFVEQMAKILLILLQSNSSDERVIREEHKTLEIEGVTYHIKQFVNRGGFGEIFKAQVRGKEKVVAIKFLANTTGIQDQIEKEVNFLRATQKVQMSNHPVIEYYGCKATSEGIYIAMELAQCDLYTFWVKRVSKASGREKFVFGTIIIMYVLRTLIFLEKLLIVHGDIKPQNLVIVEAGNYFCIKLIDFGTVEKLDTRRSSITVGADKAHTRFFASPEFLKRDSDNRISRRLHKKSDVWAAGIMFYYLLFDQMPFEDEHWIEDSFQRRRNE
ncbi:unnamed protein product [Didymodactylos carnosus]|uniref:Protein kinase domain-containing protein n=1 Tax=Didymodactylos carnosus TaxID=1234261 RepID=A0A815FXV0_9BILA|nr:unnamed protein product [Didymodactylos carnosus]CAF4185255.1 unnamed protein product [Didymodactylos carnosus]